MLRRTIILVSVSLMLVAMNPGGTPRAEAQDPGLFVSGMRTPRFPPAGDWAEVVTVTAKWLVLQNEKGQQFPVSIEAISEFVIRWPIDPSRITPGAMVETTGVDLGSSQIRSDHVDIFEGAARSMVGPTMEPLYGFNRTPSAFDIQGQNFTGIFIPTVPGEDQIPNRLHVAGGIVGLGPLRVGVARGVNTVTVLPAASGLYFSQVTPGTFSFLRTGDLVYIVPTDLTPKTLVLGQMVGYKSIPLSQFVP